MGDGCMTGSPLNGAEGRFAGMGVCGSPRVDALRPRGLPAVDKLDWRIAPVVEAGEKEVAKSEKEAIEAKFGMLSSCLHAGASDMRRES